MGNNMCPCPNFYPCLPTVNIHTRTHTGVIHTPTTWQRRHSTFTTTKVTTTTFTIIAVTNTSMTFTNFTSTDERSLSK
ncbi:hypothetical protein M8J76_016280 [Diaphorina citri]|nr:hypothetical protein M8J75_007238 [Diaphorina citri]KAI5733815.1 hypothetical protein M8J76_016280 [Diaphorina citri]